MNGVPRLASWGAGVLRQRLWIERDAEHGSVRRALGGRQQHIVNLRLDLVPHAADGVEIDAHERFERRTRCVLSIGCHWEHLGR
jgi:hypothetical protein